MKVRDIMVKDVKYCRPETNLAEATQILWANDCGSLPVVDGNNKVVGMITDRDICMALGTRNQPPAEVSVFEVKQQPQELFICAPEDDIHEALRTMRTNGVRRLPVISSGALCGILCMNEIAFHAGKRGGITNDDVVATLKAICEHRTAKQMIAA